MSSILQQYCDVTQSMAFKSSQLNSSSSFKTQSPGSGKNNKFKCFNCYNMHSASEQNYCNHCGGTSYVTDTHPLALLLNDVFERKLGKVDQVRGSVWNDFEDVQAIREEEEELDERKIICDICNKQCDVNYKYYCQCCECFFVCLNCAEYRAEQIDHQHPLATNKNFFNGFQLNLKRTNSNRENSPILKNNKKIKQFNLTESNTQNYPQLDLEALKLCKKKESWQEYADKEYFNVHDLIEQEISNLEDGMINKVLKSKFQLLIHTQNTKCQTYEQHQLLKDDCNYEKVSVDSQTNDKMLTSVRPHHSRVLNEIGIEIRESMDFIEAQDELENNDIGNRQSFGFGYNAIVEEMCNNCGANLNDFYCVCKTCEKNGISFKICHICADKKLYNHEKNHNLEMVLGNLLGRTSQMNSKSMIDSDNEDSPTLRVSKMSIPKKGSFDNRPPRLNLYPQSQNSDQKSFCKVKCSQSLNLEQSLQFNHDNIDQKQNDTQSRINMDCQSLFSSIQVNGQLKEDFEPVCMIHKKSSMYEVNNSIAEEKLKEMRFDVKKSQHVKFVDLESKQKKKIQFEHDLSDEEYVPMTFVKSQSGSEADQEQQNPTVQFNQENILSSKSKLRSLKSFSYSRTEDKPSINSSHEISNNRSSIKFPRPSGNNDRQYQSNIIEPSQPPKQEFIFYQYSCDQCGCHPIKNVRYHCMECDDFDVCGDCYGVRMLNKHGRHEFQKIDGLKSLLEKKALLLQRKDQNKKTNNNMLRSSNMLAKSKKTVDLMKKSIKNISSSITNLTKSYNSIDYVSQRLSFKVRVEQ